MPMVQKLRWILILALLPYAGFAVYDPGDLMNSVKRSQVVSDIFLERWQVMENSFSLSELEEKPLEERFYHVSRGGYARYVDLFFKYELFSGFPVRMRYFNKTYPLDLRRTALSGTVRFDDLIDFGIFRWGFALSSTGYRYGMTADIKLPVNSDLATGTADFKSTDYIYSQVYDDLIVFTQTFKPLGTLHVGLLMSKDVDPGIDGVMGTKDYGEVSKNARRIFINSDVLGVLVLNLGLDSQAKEADFITTRIEVTDVLALFTSQVQNRSLWPDLFFGYAYFNRRQENEKLSSLNQRPEGLHTLFLEMNLTYYNIFYFKTRGEAFLWGRTETEKENRVKQFYAELGFSGRSFDELAKDPEAYYQSFWKKNLTYYFIFGVSYITDSRLLNFGQEEVSKIGYCLGLNLNYAQFLGGVSLEMRLSRNYSPKLYHLIEAYDTWVGEVSLQIGF